MTLRVTNVGDLRASVRLWCQEHVPPDWRRLQSGANAEEFVGFQRWWLQELRAAGLAAPHWPVAWGGGGLSVEEQVVVLEELSRADAPSLPLYMVSLHHTPATLLTYGTESQIRVHLPAILEGEVWCQGFSEPDAGSDLANLRTRAVRDGDHFVVNGQKVWSSWARYADWCLLLVRTSTEGRKSQGISYLLLDMRSPGVDVRPIRQATGTAEFCELFLTDVVVPAANLVGPENEGWRVARATLSVERGPLAFEPAERMRRGFELLVDLARRTVLPGSGLAVDDPAVREQLASLQTEVTILHRLCVRMMESLGAPEGHGHPDASVIKVYFSELQQRLTAFGADLEGLPGHCTISKPVSAGWISGLWLLDYIQSWEWTIAGGTNEIQRTVIGERSLGLPREPVVQS